MKKLYSSLAKNKMSLRGMKTIFLIASFTSISFYSFSKETVAAHKCIIVSEPPRPLLYGLLTFKAEIKENAKVVLNWSLDAEKNTSHYIMQRSVDGREFKDAAVLFTNDRNRDAKIQHCYIDNIGEVKSNLIYYRLKIVDMNGKATYSDAVIVRKVKPEFITNTHVLHNEVA